MCRFTLVFTLMTAALCAQPADERALVAKMLQAGSDRFLGLLDTVDEKQWNFRPETFRHSIAEEAEHIAMSESGLQQVIHRALEVDPKPGLDEELGGKEELLREFFLGKESAAEKFDAPGRLASKAEVVQFYLDAHERLLALLEQAENLHLRGARHPNPAIGPLTGLQWFHYIAYHRERHVRQIERILDHPDLPGKVIRVGAPPASGRRSRAVVAGRLRVEAFPVNMAQASSNSSDVVCANQPRLLTFR
jgi:hypothetical protein